VVGADIPDADAAALVREVRGMAASLPVLVVDAGDARRRVELLGAGADVCFPPDAEFPEVRATLDALLRRGEATFPREATLQLMDEPRDAGRSRPVAAGVLGA